MYFFDTNICAFIINCKFQHLNGRYIECDNSEIKIPSVVLFELWYGFEKSQKREKTLADIRNFLSAHEIIPFDTRAAEIAAKIRADLERAGQIIGSYDIMIAATALAHGGTVITNNTREFSRVDGLTIEDWSVI